MNRLFSPSTVDVTMIIKSGGLGFGSLKAYNLALLAKWWWRVRVDKDSLWADVINDIHGNLGGTKDLSYMPKFKGMWSSISKVGQEATDLGIPLISSFQRRVGNGESICFWDDCWLGSSCLSHMFSRLFELETDKLCNLKERCSISDGVVEWKWAWRRQIRSGREQEELYSLLSMLGNTYLINDNSGGWRWSMESSGVYSVKSLRDALDEKVLLTSSETKWSSLVPKKVYVFIWRAQKDRLPTRLNLDKRNIDLDSLVCPFCEDSCEDLEHSLIACVRVKILWEKIFLWWNFQMPAEINIHVLLNFVSDMSDDKKKMFHPFQLKCFEAVIFTVAWVIWNARNQKIFSGINQTIEWCFREVQDTHFVGYQVVVK
ncbi:RNA-directed DNA polymerase, eukaryota, Reverse transcriptase zinc-binding domain protein [Artemisia annua]|uniref:RNA-directed DNA polymerase, eukaryota, Reverse transcriptase zinc-binding domain protein n=1 Tax=Artemisia annua TaxID=35608 RepID=A0A2U1NUB0_ARTAN|nr:RNA-directed DNA polymerase, eukaryota, Reverse transcriptase zinc-binding domain protein [Artemisia annua]